MTQGHERRGAMDMGRRNQDLVVALIIYVWCLEKLKVNGAFFKVHFKIYFEIALYNS